MQRLSDILRTLFGRVLRAHGRTAPALTDILIERADGRFGPRLGAQFSNGERSWTALPSDDWSSYQWDAVRGSEELRRVLVRDARSIYAQMLREQEPQSDAERGTWLMERIRRLANSSRPNLGHSLFATVARGLFDDDGRTGAQERGLQLLRENLSPAQRDQYDRHRYFDVTGGKTGRRYRIRQGRMMNVYQIDKRGRSICGWCFFPRGDLVSGDVMLAQKTALELYEPEVLEIANRF